MKAYPLPFSEVIGKELEAMLELGVIETLNSPYSSPVVIFKKKDGTNRFCVNYRKLRNLMLNQWQINH